MIVRSRITPASAGDEERGGDRHQNRGLDVPGHRQLHDVGGVGAEHHQLAVRHVDDAHDAEGNRQPDGDQHQHRSEAEAEEQRLDARVERAAPDRCGAPPRPRRAGPRRRFRRNCRPAPCSSRAASRLRTSARRRCDSAAIASRRDCAIAAVQRGERQAGLDLLLDAGVGFDADPLAQQRQARLVERRASFPSRRPAAPTTSGLDSAKRATAVLSTRLRRLFVLDLGQLVARRPSRRPSATADRSARRTRGCRRRT